MCEGIDNLFGQRDKGQEDNNTAARLLTTLLTELDGAADNDNVFVIATSCGDVDSALKRFGRIGLVVELYA